MTVHVKVDNAYKTIDDCKVNIGGIWKKVRNIYTNVDGVWKNTWELAIPAVGNFETDNDGWSLVPYHPTYSSVVRSSSWASLGSYSVHIKKISGVNGGGWIYKYFDLTNVTQLMFDLKIVSACPFFVYIDDVQVLSTSYAVGTYYGVTVDISAYAGVRKVEIWISNGNNSPAEGYIDNIRFDGFADSYDVTVLWDCENTYNGWAVTANSYVGAYGFNSSWASRVGSYCFYMGKPAGTVGPAILNVVKDIDVTNYDTITFKFSSYYPYGMAFKLGTTSLTGTVVNGVTYINISGYSGIHTLNFELAGHPGYPYMGYLDHICAMKKLD